MGHNYVVKETKITKELCDQQIIDNFYERYYVLALTKSVKCISWGFNDRRQLRNGTQNNENKSKVINAYSIKSSSNCLRTLPFITFSKFIRPESTTRTLVSPRTALSPLLQVNF